jgi:crotonobetainyl-CoA:carnitine CoA-transferase CaiB-like acyl-CoA transferase
MSYAPLRGVKVLDLGILIPAALTSGKLAALGADVVKVEQPPTGDRIRLIPPYAQDGASPQHMAQSWGKRSIGLDVRDPQDRGLLLALIGQADVVVENQLAGFWASQGIDFAALRAERPALIVCSVTGFGQTGPWSSLPSHGLNMDALGDTLNLEWENGQPHRGWTFTSWGNELGTAFAAMAILAAIVSVRSGGEGAWIDLSCWDALVESHRTEIAMTTKTRQPFSLHAPMRQALYDTYLSSDGVPVLLGTLEPKFWARFCERIGRPDLANRHDGAAIAFGDDDSGLRAELEIEFGKATAAEWLERFVAWDVPGAPVLDVPAIMRTDHYAARGIVTGAEGDWPSVATAIRWHHLDERAGTALTPPPAYDQHHDEVLRDWLG